MSNEQASPMGESRIIARCCGCKRGYIYLHHDGAACLACGSPVYLLAKSDSALDAEQEGRHAR